MNYETFAFTMLILAIFNLGFGFWLGVKVCTWLVASDKSSEQP